MTILRCIRRPQTSCNLVSRTLTQKINRKVQLCAERARGRTTAKQQILTFRCSESVTTNWLQRGTFTVIFLPSLPCIWTPDKHRNSRTDILKACIPPCPRSPQTNVQNIFFTNPFCRPSAHRASVLLLLQKQTQ